MSLQASVTWFGLLLNFLASWDVTYGNEAFKGYTRGVRSFEIVHLCYIN
jgi:hypothetical protein